MRVAVLAEKVDLDADLEVVVGLVGDHVWRLGVSVGASSFVFPFDVAQADFCGHFTDFWR